jgi:integrase/recombinase XerC
VSWTGHYLPRVSEAVNSGTRRVHGSYWNRILQEWGPRPITDVTALEISQLGEQIKTTAVKRKNARTRARAAGALTGAQGKSSWRAGAAPD